ncbi:hypothetical protein M0R45_006558 [Rubus argutus]|uniref:Uncharacterized protein n=1 Tax=Rubus argutus TaxID=59490 RepID=A0AAW1YRC6_RUBAR
MINTTQFHKERIAQFCEETERAREVIVRQRQEGNDGGSKAAVAACSFCSVQGSNRENTAGQLGSTTLAETAMAWAEQIADGLKLALLAAELFTMMSYGHTACEHG